MPRIFRSPVTTVLALTSLMASASAMLIRTAPARVVQSQQKYSWTGNQAQSVQFSSDMKILMATGQTQMLKLYVGDKRARLDRSAQDGEREGIGSILLDFQSQLIYLLIPQSNLYLQIEGSLGTPFYRGGWLFRPETKNYPCSAWVREADDRGISLRCSAAGQETLNGLVVQRWNATTSHNSHGSLWYDPSLNFVIKVQRVSPQGTQTGYELENIKVGTQPTTLFNVPDNYRKFTLPKLLDALSGGGQW